MYIQKYPNLFKPLKLRGLIIRNRLMSAPNMLFRTIDGRPDEYYVSYIEHKARGGAGIVSLGEANVADGGNHTPGMETTQENMAIYAEMARAVHEHGGAAAVELTHGGHSIKPQFNNDPSKFFGPVDFVNMHGAQIHAMTEADMEYVIRGYSDTAAYYQACGFDILHIHSGHAWLLEQFLSPVVNKRTDNYGGSLENRMRFPIRVLEEIRRRVGPQQVVTIRISGSERTPDGFTPEDMAIYLVKAQEYVDMVEVSSEHMPYTFGPTFMPHGQNVELAERIKKTGLVRIPVFAIGSIVSPEQAEEIIASGRADGVAMSRALIADPYLPKKAMDAREDEIRPCLRCLNCTDSDNMYRHFVCSVNPLTAHEMRLGFGEDIGTAAHKKKVLVVGGGPAGLQAAITAHERGHEVVLCEATDSLGGMLRFTDNDTVKLDLRRFKNYLVNKAKSSGIHILLNTECSQELVDSVRPDNIIVATGAEPVVPTGISGFENARHATAIYFDPSFTPANDIVIVGGGLIGVEAAMHLARLGKKITILEMADEIARDAKAVYKISLLMQLHDSKDITVVTNAAVTEIQKDGVVYEKDGKSVKAAGGTVLYAVGMRSNETPYFDLYDKAPYVNIIGDAKKVGKVDGAIHGGFFAGIDVGAV
ncbi:MAG: FAD-dependent oxidoreductase [Oscillospiraceae bacterium]|jgi:2,4-dienoyl-CoA reductase-like NADH-dependent reductase (Old Yellow Enzyme family)|nr:FAD-dependent oxidoreductase [Oscillospiraceae bacterium]